MRLRSYEIDKKGNYLFNNLLFHVKPYYLVPRNANLNAANPEQIQMGAGAASAQVPLYVVDEGAFEGGYLSAQYTAPCLIEMVDDVRKMPLTGRPCHVATIFGNGQEPFILPESIFLDKREAILFRATDLSGDANDIRPIICGQRLFSDRARDKHLDTYIQKRLVRSRYCLPFMCPLDKDVIIAAGVTSDWYYTQDAIAHFEVFKITYTSTYDFRFKIVDETGQEMQNDWIYSTAGIGTAFEPFIFYGSWAIKAGGKVKFTIENLNDNYSNYIYITLTGRLFFV